MVEPLVWAAAPVLPFGDGDVLRGPPLLQEVERLTAQLLQVRKDRALLQRQVEQFEQQQQQQTTNGDTPAHSSEDQQLLQQQQRHVLQQPDAELASLQAELEAAQEAARDQEHEVGGCLMQQACLCASFLAVCVGGCVFLQPPLIMQTGC
jgi:hypothetical protein